MGKKSYLIIILLTIAVNVVMLQWTIESYYGLEYDHVYLYTAIALISSAICLTAYFGWRKKEYNSKPQKRQS
ncbi:hypothetical protein EJF36_16585 [Bacillus sp. HMF5848]|uniref:hypothetical protein n=1 Tax=Bacillus sp. HMF5848 TaxID=2495421 RepID=UPI000F783144|nr:hypothetical protein [Bacillus sp. HMF5848]RSK28350.1 hypothetical protein EJF36_16585 [Bacillus sp. HMF5848]